MAYKVIILYQLYMPSYFLGTFTEYPYLAFCSVIPWGLEPQSKEPESFILSIELRNQMRCKDNKKKKRGTMSPFIF